ncbi:hypothetical protein D5085_09905 [Ectothiorhodospiraceae bacterium BW-2]|nr:hypothetical protein D5085_09905 [Ectothiorhodospiraceae bacterium BW-2]
MPSINRRQWIQQAVTAALIPTTLATSTSTALATEAESPPNPFALQFTIDKGFSADLSPQFQRKLVQAILDIIQKHYNQNSLPVWSVSFKEANLPPRLESISHWLVKGCEQHRAIYPVDPVWIMAQMMLESFFYERAISWASAVGVCQFIRPTAQSYQMVCAGDRAEHRHPPFLKPEYAKSLDDYYQFRRELSRYRDKNWQKALEREECLKLMAAGDLAKIGQRLQENDNYYAAKAHYEAQIKRSRNEYRDFLRLNSAGKSILKDSTALAALDERLTHEKPVPAMVQMLAEHLRARKGNMLIAAAGYHAGLSRTKAQSLYEPYGRIPVIQSTVDYLSKIIVIYHELRHRL